MRITYILAAGVSVLLLNGCSSTDLITRKQMETEGRVEQILLASAAQRSQLSELSREVQELSKRVASQEEALSAQKAEISTLKTGLSSHRTDKAAPASSTIEVVSGEPSKPDSESIEQEAYMKAFGIFSANRYQEAISAFTVFIGAYPDSEYSANAQYWIGECHYSQKNYQSALDAFNAVLTKFPKGKKVPDAMLKVAYSQLSLDDQASAMATMQKLIETFPKSPAAAKAKDRLNALKQNTR